MPQQTWIPAKQTGTLTMEARHKTHTVHTGCWQFWHQIRQQRTCTTSQERTRRTLQTYMRLDRQTIHWDNIGLGLQQAPCPSIHAKLRAKSSETISTQSRQTTACAIPKYTNTIWRKGTICNTSIRGTTIRGLSQAVHPTGMWQVAIPW